MQLDWKPYVLALVLALLCWNFWLRIGDLSDQVSHLTDANKALVDANQSLKDSLEVQNKAVNELQASAEAGQAAAETRAEPIRQALPKKITVDRAAGTEPKEMNQWLKSLFSLP